MSSLKYLGLHMRNSFTSKKCSGKKTFVLEQKTMLVNIEVFSKKSMTDEKESLTTY